MTRFARRTLFIVTTGIMLAATQYGFAIWLAAYGGWLLTCVMAVDDSR